MLIAVGWPPAVIAGPAEPLVLAVQSEPDDEEAARIRERDRTSRSEREQREERSREMKEADDVEPALDTLERRSRGDVGGKASDRAPEGSGERGHGEEVSAEMLERRDQRKETMETYRESGEKVTGQKPWYEDSTGQKDRDDSAGQDRRKEKADSGNGNDGDESERAKGRSGKGKGKN
jgi:hypothetical protein